MIRFKQFITEIYKPIAKDAVQWKKEKEEFGPRSFQLHYIRHKLPDSGTILDIQVGKSPDEKIHNFGFTVDGSYYKRDFSGELSREDQKAATKHVAAAFQHYSQHILPVGHTLVGQSIGHTENENEKKNSIYYRAMNSFAKTNKKFKYSKNTTYNRRSITLGDNHELTRIAEQINEIYKPIAKKAYEWKNINSEYLPGKILKLTGPHGTKLHISVTNDPEGQISEPTEHSFDFSVNDQISKHDYENKSYTHNQNIHPEDQHFIRKHLAGAFNHYAQHHLPKGHELTSQALEYGDSTLKSKDATWGKLTKMFADRSGGKFRYQKQKNNLVPDEYKNQIKSNLGDKHIIVKENEEERIALKHSVRKLPRPLRLAAQPVQTAMLYKSISDRMKEQHPMRQGPAKRALEKITKGRAVTLGQRARKTRIA